jgi:hypothetical protein
VQHPRRQSSSRTRVNGEWSRTNIFKVQWHHLSGMCVKTRRVLPVSVIDLRTPRMGSRRHNHYTASLTSTKDKLTYTGVRNYMHTKWSIVLEDNCQLKRHRHYLDNGT